MNTPGQAAFEKWVQLLKGTYPATWRQLGDAERVGWEQIADAAHDARVAHTRAAVQSMARIGRL